MCREALEQKDEQEPVAIGTEWMPCVKLPIVVHVREQREGESHVSTREGITPVKHDDLIMRGVEGEEYPIGRALFDRTYTFTVDKHQERKPMTDGEYERAYEHARTTFRHHKTSIKGQQITHADSFEWHLFRAIERAHGIGGEE